MDNEPEEVQVDETAERQVVQEEEPASGDGRGELVETTPGGLETVAVYDRNGKPIGVLVRPVSGAKGGDPRAGGPSPNVERRPF